MAESRGGGERPVKFAGRGGETEGAASKQGAATRPTKTRLPPKRGSVIKKVVAGILNTAASST